MSNLNGSMTLLNSKDFVDDIIETKSFHHVYQPIYYLLSNHLLGYEALLRSDFFTPSALFNLARKTNKSYELDTASIYTGISTFYQLEVERPDSLLFVNVLPSTILHPNFLNFIKQCGGYLPAEKIVFEINECGCIGDYDILKGAISYLRKRGFRIALDDVGAGESSIPKMIELEPEFIKLDRYLVQNLSKSTFKQRLIEMFVHYCQNDIALILEGIENLEDLAMAKSIGVCLGQGFLLGKPDRVATLIKLPYI